MMAVMTRKHKTIWLATAALSSSLFFAACRDRDTEDVCVSCPFGGAAVRCYTSPWSFQDICAVDQTIAFFHCFEANGDGVVMPICDLEPQETGEDPYGPWEPGGSVTMDRVTGEYVIDQDAFEQLKLDPSPLLGDSSHLGALESGYYQVQYAGELTDALGWQAGDIILAINGYPLQGFDQFATAYTNLAQATVFRLTVERERAQMVLRYRVE